MTASEPMADVTFGGDVKTVLQTRPLDQAPRHPRGGPQPARTARADRGDHPPDRVRGHQVRLLPAGLHHGARDGQGRGRVVLPAGGREGLPARLWRHRQPLHRPRRRLHRLRPRGVRARRDRGPGHLRPTALGPARGARVLRLLRHRDRRAARRRSAPEPEARDRGVRGGAGLQLPDRDRAGDDVAQGGSRRRSARRRDQAVLLPHPPVRGAPSGAARRGRVRAGAGARHELRRPRGRARPARAELPLRPAREDGRQHHHLPPDLRGGGPQARPPPHLHAQALQRRVGQRPPPSLHALRRRTATTSSTTPTGPPSCPTPPGTSSAACSSTSAPSCAWATRP